MQSLNISLPEPLKEFVDGQIAAGRTIAVPASTCASSFAPMRSARPKSV